MLERVIGKENKFIQIQYEKEEI
uniref:Uncharacterized protein n=1 Tax=Nelumbo nucifera TaxID=4432 RepID=A0A822XX44_NELNU|nr:TPA_asm: hypothetical protein HUJ06_026361 [Nelumbo nucifera]